MCLLVWNHIVMKYLLVVNPYPELESVLYGYSELQDSEDNSQEMHYYKRGPHLLKREQKWIAQGRNEYWHSEWHGVLLYWDIEEQLSDS